VPLEHPVIGLGGVLGGFERSSQHRGVEVAMRTRWRRSDRAGRGVLRSPGRPPVARREDRLGFWAAIAAGVASEDAAVHAGVSPAVGGAMVPGGRRHATVTALAVVEAAVRAVSVLRRARGGRACAGAGPRGAGGRPPARAGGVDDLAGVAAQRRHAWRRPGVPGHHGPVARRAVRASPEDGEAPPVNRRRVLGIDLLPVGTGRP
jgi:hypothetical protein